MYTLNVVLPSKVTEVIVTSLFDVSLIFALKGDAMGVWPGDPALPIPMRKILRTISNAAR